MSPLNFISRSWKIICLVIALNSLLFFGVFGFYLMLTKGSVVFYEPSAAIARIELALCLLASIGLAKILLAELRELAGPKEKSPFALAIRDIILELGIVSHYLRKYRGEK